MEGTHTGLACVFVCLCVASAVAQPAPVLVPDSATAPPPANPMPLTTDTVEYCAHLAGQLDQYRDARVEARDLIIEGRRMCDEGHVIGGLMRLRHAMMILRETGATRTDAR